MAPRQIRSEGKHRQESKKQKKKKNRTDQEKKKHFITKYSSNKIKSNTLKDLVQIEFENA